MTTRSDIANVLTAAKAKLANPEHWIQYTNARDSLGEAVSPLSSDACQFCIIGALCRASDDLNSEDYIDAYIDAYLDASKFLRKEVPAKFASGLSNFNDDPSTTHADVIALFDKAIEDTQ